MAERSGKVGAFYATSGSGHLTTESGTLTANKLWLDNKNVVVTDVYKSRDGTGDQYTRWECTPRGHLTVRDADDASAGLSVTYRWFAEEGEPQADTGSIKQYGGFFSWSIDDTADTLETTNFADGGHRNYIISLDGWTGSAERHWVNSGMFSLVGSKIIAKFYADDDDEDKGSGSSSDTGKRYEGYCQITGINPSTAVDSLVNESLSFQGTGELQYES